MERTRLRKSSCTRHKAERISYSAAFQMAVCSIYKWFQIDREIDLEQRPDGEL